jgi:hypothetical protein
MTRAGQLAAEYVRDHGWNCGEPECPECDIRNREIHHTFICGFKAAVGQARGRIANTECNTSPFHKDVIELSYMESLLEEGKS